MLAQLKADYPEELRIVYRHFPLISIHDKASLAAQASQAAGLQDSFWEMYQTLYAMQGAWSGLSLEDFKAWTVDRAEELGLDTVQFTADMESDEVVNQVGQNYNDAVTLQVPGTPFLLINGRIYGGPTDYANLSIIIELLALETRQYTECPPTVITPDANYTAAIKTEAGDIVIELFADEAPIAVNNFIFLAQEGWYNGVSFHRVLSGQIAQAGDPTGTGYGSPGYAFVNEDTGRLFDQPGLLAMANSGMDSNGGQFFITTAPLPHLNGGYTIFGEVIEGQDIVENLTPRDPSQGGNLPEGDLILSIEITKQ